MSFYRFNTREGSSLSDHHYSKQLISLHTQADNWRDQLVHTLREKSPTKFLGDDLPSLEPYHKQWFDMMTSEENLTNNHATIQKWAKQIVDFFINHRISSQTLFALLRAYRETFQHLFETHVSIEDLTARDAFTIVHHLSTRTELLVEQVSAHYISFQVHALELTRKEMHALSIPLVPVWENIAVLPIIGDLDDERSQHLHSQTLERATELNLSYIVIDLSGINSINTWFAQHLSNLINALKLLGITVTLSGMRPELSQTIVRLGIKFKDATTYLTLEQALYSIRPFAEK